jgi:hypothetical protein
MHVYFKLLYILLTVPELIQSVTLLFCLLSLSLYVYLAIYLYLSTYSLSILLFVSVYLCMHPISTTVIQCLLLSDIGVTDVDDNGMPVLFPLNEIKLR